MKIGMRTPSPTKSVKAKTTGRVKRAMNKSVNPVYGQKGIGYLKDPEQAVKNRIYHQVTVDPLKNMKKTEIPDFEPDDSTLVLDVILYILLSLVSIYCSITFIYNLMVHEQFGYIRLIIGIASIGLLFLVKKL